MSMLPNNSANKPAMSAGGGGAGNNYTANSFSDRHSMVSGTALCNQEPSDVEMLSQGAAGGPPSEAGSLFDTQQNNSGAAVDERRELELAYKDLQN